MGRRVWTLSPMRTISARTVLPLISCFWTSKLIDLAYWLSADKQPNARNVGCRSYSRSSSNGQPSVYRWMHWKRFERGSRGICWCRSRSSLDETSQTSCTCRGDRDGSQACCGGDGTEGLRKESTCSAEEYHRIMRGAWKVDSRISYIVALVSCFVIIIFVVLYSPSTCHSCLHAKTALMSLLLVLLPLPQFWILSIRSWVEEPEYGSSSSRMSPGSRLVMMGCPAYQPYVSL